MAQRTVCLCEDQFIGIESIFTVINSQQINIPEKLEHLRTKSKENKLFCPCGCGSNLVLVAGDKNLREQHFRLKYKQHSDSCRVVTEGTKSIHSKILIKCWLEEKLNPISIETRVPICSIDSATEKYEFSFLLTQNALAVNYCYDRNNLSDEKLKILEDNAKDIKIIHILDSTNAGNDGQYPEWLMKIQSRQKYCLFLHLENQDYNKAHISAAFYAQNAYGLWKEIIFAENKLQNFMIDSKGSIHYNNQTLDSIYQTAFEAFDTQITEEKLAIEEQKNQMSITRSLTNVVENISLSDTSYPDISTGCKSENHAEINYNEPPIQPDEISQLDFKKTQTQIRDSSGARWVECVYCGLRGTEEYFQFLGGIGTINTGTCKQCNKNRPSDLPFTIREKTKYDRNKFINICPYCNSQLTERNGKHGKFIGCSNFPKCKYTRNVKL